MRHTFLVVTVKIRLQWVYIYGSYRKIKTGVPLFWTTLYTSVMSCSFVNKVLRTSGIMTGARLRNRLFEVLCHCVCPVCMYTRTRIRVHSAYCVWKCTVVFSWILNTGPHSCIRGASNSLAPALEIFAFKLYCGLGVTQGHRKWHHSIACIWFPITVL